jgi:hypothetical protein
VHRITVLCCVCYSVFRYGALALANMALSPSTEIVQIFASKGLLDRIIKMGVRQEIETQREVTALIRLVWCLATACDATNCCSDKMRRISSEIVYFYFLSVFLSLQELVVPRHSPSDPHREKSSGCRESCRGPSPCLSSPYTSHHHT